MVQNYEKLMTLQHVLEKKRSIKPTFTPERSILRQKTDIRIGKETRVRRGEDDEDILARPSPLGECEGER